MFWGGEIYLMTPDPLFKRDYDVKHEGTKSHEEVFAVVRDY